MFYEDCGRLASERPVSIYYFIEFKPSIPIEFQCLNIGLVVHASISLDCEDWLALTACVVYSGFYEEAANPPILEALLNG